MIKNMQLKVILIFCILGIFIITGIGIIYSISLEELLPDTVNIQNAQYILELEQQLKRIEFITIIANILVGILSMGIALVLFKKIENPKTKQIKGATSWSVVGENEGKENKRKAQKDNLIDEFETITNEIGENLNEVNRQKKQMEAILLHMTDGIIVFSMEGNITHINPAAIEFLKISEKDNTFERIFKKVNIDINLEKIVYLEDWTSSEQRVQVEERYLNIFFASLKDENERPSGIMVVIQDITEHVKLDNMRKEFVADVSHELKTPITSIMGYSDTLLEGEYDKETQDKFLNVISTEARRMAKLVTDLLILSRYDSNKVNYEVTEFDLGELTKKCQEKLQIEIDKKKQNAECFVTANVPPVYANKEGIERVILNILSNSIKYTKEAGNIKIYVGFVYNDAYIKVIDNGIGIPEEELNRIFDRFYRVDKARTRELGGTGLGLSIAKEILDKNRGSIDIKSQLGKGTEVVIRVPTKK